MKKIFVLLFLIISINISEEGLINDVDKFYQDLKQILKGMSKQDNLYECGELFEKNEVILLGIMKDIFGNNTESKNLDIISIISKLLQIEGLASKCNIFQLVEIYLKVNTVEGFKDIGKAVSANAKAISESFTKMETSKSENETNIQLGKIISNALNYFVK